MKSLEICAGAGGQALGVELAGFGHSCLVELDKHACKTLRMNRPHWLVEEMDLRNFSATNYKGVNLFAGGVPCPPFSKAGKQLGNDDDRDLFPEALRLISECRPDAVMLENVRGILDTVFDDYRAKLILDLKKLGYQAEWRLLNASDYGVSQLRPRVVFVALQKDAVAEFKWPEQNLNQPHSVGELLKDLMKVHGWRGADAWAKRASDIAPTLVGGSKKHGGPDLGPTRARNAWASLGVDGRGLADSAPDKNFLGMPRLTNRMAARVQGFPDSWVFSGGKTATYRQIGNAFPPPVAQAVANSIRLALEARAKRRILKAA